MSEDLAGQRKGIKNYIAEENDQIKLDLNRLKMLSDTIVQINAQLNKSWKP